MEDIDKLLNDIINQPEQIVIIHPYYKCLSNEKKLDILNTLLDWVISEKNKIV